MIKYLIIILSFLIPVVMTGCADTTSKETSKSPKPESNTAAVQTSEVSEEVQDSVLLGYQNREVLEQTPFDSWFAKTYQDYKPKEKVLTTLKPLLQDADLTIFMGTWCEDSQREIPALFQILDQTEFDTDQLTLITVSRNKDTPEKLEEGFDLEYVPTIIISKDGAELGRIVESPIGTLEKDLVRILEGKPYKHTYAQ